MITMPLPCPNSDSRVLFPLPVSAMRMTVSSCRILCTMESLADQTGRLRLTFMIPSSTPVFRPWLPDPLVGALTNPPPLPDPALPGSPSSLTFLPPFLMGELKLGVRAPFDLFSASAVSSFRDFLDGEDCTEVGRRLSGEEGVVGAAIARRDGPAMVGASSGEERMEDSVDMATSTSYH